MDATLALGDFVIFLQIIKNLELQNQLENKIIIFSVVYKEIVKKVLPNLENKIFYIKNNHYNHWEVPKFLGHVKYIKVFKKCIKDCKNSIPNNMSFNNVYYFCQYYDFSLLAVLSKINYKKIYALSNYEDLVCNKNNLFKDKPEFFGSNFLSNPNKKWISKLPFFPINWIKKIVIY